ncbi:HvfC/BufC N-terminal domain-containing protein [Vibrio comitans]
MSSLSELQSNFARSLVYQGDVSECHIHSDHFTDEQRIQIYRNNVIHSFIDVLKVMYPYTLALVGEECFEQIARSHVLNTPSLSGNVSHYGQGFEKTISAFPKVIEAAPYISEVARFEALGDELKLNLHNAIENTHRPLSALSQLSEQQQQKLCLVSKASVRSFESSYSIFNLIEAIDRNSFDNLQLNQSQYGYVQATINGRLHFHPLEHNEFLLLRAIENKQPLSEINEQLLPSIPSLVDRMLIAGFI